MRQLASVYGVNLDEAKLASDVADITNLEYELAFNYTTDDVTRRQQRRNYNPFSLSTAQSAFPFLNWTTILAQTTVFAEQSIKDLAVSDSFTFFIMEPEQLSKLQDALLGGTFTPRQVINYLFYRIVDAYFPTSVSLLPSTSCLSRVLSKN